MSNKDEVTLKTFDNCFMNRKKDSSKHGIIISGHRGGQFGKEPENTIRAFQKAIEMGLDSIEFDIWLTSDDQLVVIHGGYNGEFPHPVEELDDNVQKEPLYIFDHTYEELQ